MLRCKPCGRMVKGIRTYTDQFGSASTMCNTSSVASFRHTCVGENC